MPATILVTDDDEDLRVLIELQLKIGGFEVTKACNGLEALEVARTDPPSLILLDLMMPVMDGWDCLAELKADERLRDIPVFVITGKSQRADREHAIAQGADAFISKPFHAPELIARIREHLGQTAA